MLNLPNTGKCGEPGPEPIGSFGIFSNGNPFISTTDISVKSKLSQTIHIQVMDMTGRKISAWKLESKTGVQKISLHANSWPVGIYIIHAFNDAGEKQTLKLFKGN